MKIIGAINANLDESPLGTRARLRDEIAGVPVLRRTVERALRIDGIDGIYVLVPPDHAGAVRLMLDGLAAHVETHDAPPPPCRELVRASRFWGLDGWRGGIGSLCVFDEDFNPALLHGLAKKTNADAVLSISAAAPLLEPALLSGMVAHFRQNIESARMTIMQAPPGLTGLIVARDILDQLLPTSMPPGALLIYQPSSPAPDLTGREACFRPDAAIVRATGRLLCDTDRSTRRVERIFAAGGNDWDARTLCEWLLRDAASRVESPPAEIEIELTTEDQFAADDLLRPRGVAVPTRGPIDMPAIERVVECIGDADDVRIVLGGFGEPTLHPRFAEICKRLRDAGAGAIAVRINGIALPAAAEDAMFRTPIDVVEITIDADSADTYARVHGTNAFDKVMATIERLSQLRSDRQSVRPLIAPSMIKSAETLDDMESFVDRWQQKLGIYALTGASHYARQRPDRAVTSMTPPKREPCRRVFSRVMILADGSVTTCDQDFAGRQTVGSLREEALETIWHAQRLRDIRAMRHEDCALCSNCDEWHRP